MQITWCSYLFMLTLAKPNEKIGTPCKLQCVRGARAWRALSRALTNYLKTGNAVRVKSMRTKMQQMRREGQ